MQDKHLTRVLFRIETMKSRITGENYDSPLAIFIDNKGSTDLNAQDYSCYCNLTQHSIASHEYVVKCTKNAEHGEPYHELQCELEKIGYNLEIIHRLPKYNPHQ